MSEKHVLPITGGCACGALRYTLSSLPSGTVRCYCRQCQRASGSGHSDQVIVSASDLDMAGAASRARYTADNGNDVEKTFCPQCGSPVLNRSSGHPDLTFLFAASLDRPGPLEPGMRVWTEAAQPWDPPSSDT